MQHNDPPSLIYSLITKPPPLKSPPPYPTPVRGKKITCPLLKKENLKILLQAA